ncbi:MAG: CHASE2 domain-containing protein, partial [Anaerolineales bacterium]|nr:CHASE2 domain-containing protein [Anaerolineales bacterium]
MSFLQKIVRLPVVAILIICSLSFLGVTAVRNAGLLEYLELTAYDWFMRSSLKGSPADSRIVIIEITENDILHLGKWPLTDQLAAQALTMLSSYNPRAIGFDIYRDIPVPPGTEELNAILTSNQRIITVMKFGSGGIPPPPVLAQTAQVGFNDIVVDPGGTVRRGLLFLDNGETFSSSFDLLLALLYLQEEGIVPRPDETNPEYLRLGPATIHPFEADDGGYVRADARGYQYLLDYGGSRGHFTSFTLNDLLSGEIAPESVRDRIVIVGVAAQSVKDLFYTPYSRGIIGGGQAVPGVVMHAHVVSQLLRFGLGENRPILTATEKQEMCWILFWSFLGGAMGFWLRSPWFFSLCG